jgi:hypothetical protein
VEKILAANVRALMLAHADLNTQMKVAEATRRASRGPTIDQTTVGRILAAKHKAQLDTVEVLAEVFGVEPYQLLVPGLDAKNPQVLRSLSPAEERLYKALEEARKPGTQ